MRVSFALPIWLLQSAYAKFQGRTCEMFPLKQCRRPLLAFTIFRLNQYGFYPHDFVAHASCSTPWCNQRLNT